MSNLTNNPTITINEDNRVAIKEVWTHENAKVQTVEVWGQSARMARLLREVQIVNIVDMENMGAKPGDRVGEAVQLYVINIHLCNMDSLRRTVKRLA